MILVYKPLGLTPLQAIERLKKKKPELLGKTLSYAGRLDPMAEGMLLILVGSENKKRREFEHLEKEYEFEALFGISTDSYDLLGIPEQDMLQKRVKTSEINEFINKSKGKIIQKYPPYSSFKIKGKPLYWWARNDRKIDMPERETNIIKFELLKQRKVTAKKLGEVVFERVNLVRGDFRQEKILMEWRSLLGNTKIESFQIAKFRLKCSSGGYVRSIVNELGEFLGVKAVAFSIKRTGVGKYGLSSALDLMT